MENHYWKRGKLLSGKQGVGKIQGRPSQTVREGGKKRMGGGADGSAHIKGGPKKA